MIAARIALERVDEKNGCLWVIPGSHKLGLLPHGAVKNERQRVAPTDLARWHRGHSVTRSLAKNAEMAQ